MRFEYEYVKIESLEIVRLGKDAILLRTDDWEHWIPYSQIEDNGEKLLAGEEYDGLFLTTWICEKKGIKI